MSKHSTAGIGRDYIGVSAGAVIQNGQGEYFLAHRSKGARDDQGKWEFPGGSVNLMEPRENAVARIIAEKYAMDIEIDRVLGVYDVIDEEQADHWVSTTYMCRWVGGTPTISIPEECDQVGWFTADVMKKLDLSRISKLNMHSMEPAEAK